MHRKTTEGRRKRDPILRVNCSHAVSFSLATAPGSYCQSAPSAWTGPSRRPHRSSPVSYTHLTLPTILLV
eukprot:1057228-Pleurochrysis_carterae.AAC.2